mgnify:CR=1 FL=1
MDTFIREVGEERINEAVKRILTVKFKLEYLKTLMGMPIIKVSMKRLGIQKKARNW